MGARGIAFGAPEIDLEQAARVEELGRQEADRRPARCSRSSARSRSCRAPGRFVSPNRARGDGQQRLGAHPLRSVHHRRRLGGDPAARAAGRSAHHGFDRCARAARVLRRPARHRRRHHRARDGLCLRRARQPGQRRGADTSSSCRAAIRISCGRSSSASARRYEQILLGTKVTRVEALEPKGLRVSFEGEKAPAPQMLRPRAGGRGTRAQRQVDRRGGGRRQGVRSRLHPGRQADAHQRAAHLCDRRHRRSAHAGAQGDARSEGCRGSRGRPQERVRCARDSFGRLHGSGDCLGGPHRDRGEGARALRSRRAPSRGRRAAARSRSDATRASPSCCSTPRPTACSAAASSAPMRASSSARSRSRSRWAAMRPTSA